MKNQITNQSNGSHVDRMNSGGAIIRSFALFPLMLLILLLLPAGMVAQKAASSSKYIATYESSTQTLTFKKNVGETLPENSAWVEDKQTVATINIDAHTIKSLPQLKYSHAMEPLQRDLSNKFPSAVSGL